jgi:DNA-binding transcriptional regulator YhcF (GntR family)
MAERFALLLSREFLGYIRDTKDIIEAIVPVQRTVQMLKLEFTPGGAIVDQVVSGIAGMIGSRQLPPGRKLPSIRELAAANGISKSTVVEAYDRLVAQGLLASRHKVGFFVAGQRPVLDLTENAPPTERDLDPLWALRNTLQPAAGLLLPGCGWLPEDWLNGDGLRRALRSLARAPHAQLTNYGQPLGYAPLRGQLQVVFADRGIEAPANRILITDGAMHAIDLVGRLLIRPGDRVFVDDPCYFNVLANMRAHRAQVIGVPFLRSGPDLEVFSALAAEHRPVLYITNSALHNPTGATLSPAVAHRLLKIAEAFDIAILEDDIYADFEEQPAPRLAAMDQLARVIYTGSFSKTLSAAQPLRLDRRRAGLDRGFGGLEDGDGHFKQRTVRAVPLRSADGWQLSQTRRERAGEAANGVGSRARTAERLRTDALDRTSRRHVSVGDAAGRRRLGRRRAARARERHSHGAGQRLQRFALGGLLHALQRGPVVEPADLRFLARRTWWVSAC